MVTFCKSPVCPSSQVLLRYENGETSIAECKGIEAHLTVCEFCASELEFYAHYPQSEEPVATVEIPIPLYELAQALLNIKHRDCTALDRLFSENESVKV